ncbi:50S ribosomal protein L19, partial [Treponema pallidum]
EKIGKAARIKARIVKKPSPSA